LEVSKAHKTNQLKVLVTQKRELMLQMRSSEDL
jgi:hypothetical protein